MTCALVNPTSGYSTLSRFERDSRRPSIVTSVPPATSHRRAPGAGRPLASKVPERPEPGKGGYSHGRRFHGGPGAAGTVGVSNLWGSRRLVELRRVGVAAYNRHGSQGPPQR